MPDCYKCEYRKSVPGDAHSSCHHPDFDHSNVTLQLACILGIPIQTSPTKIKVIGNKHGIRNGWFQHPFNFDPIWLEECNGFKEIK